MFLSTLENIATLAMGRTLGYKILAGHFQQASILLWILYFILCFYKCHWTHVFNRKEKKHFFSRAINHPVQSRRLNQHLYSSFANIKNLRFQLTSNIRTTFPPSHHPRSCVTSSSTSFKVSSLSATSASSSWKSKDFKGFKNIVIIKSDKIFGSFFSSSCFFKEYLTTV